MAKELRFDVTALDQASKTFTRLGQAVERFEKRLDRLDGKRVSADVEVNTDKADREIGRFATDTRRKLQAALSNLPEIELDADSTPLDRKLADVRRRMAQLADKTIGVDLSAEEAIAEARLLHSELERLGRESPDIQVQTDIAAAMAQLAAVDAAVDRVDGRKATIKIDVDKSISETLIQVAQLGRALGALALPAAIVTAAPQIAALGAAALDTVGAVGLIPGVATTAAAAVGTLVIGFKNFGDAVGDDPKKAAEALGKLAPAARETALAVREMAPAWEALRLEVQQELFEGMGERVRALGGLYLPVLQNGLSRVGEALNGGVTEVAEYFRRWQQVDQVSTILSNAQGAVENLSYTFRPLLAAVTDVAEVGSQVFQDLTAGAEDAANGFAAMVRRAQESGELKAWIQGGVDALGRLFSITGNVGSLLSSVFEAGEQASGNFLVNADRVTEVMADWANSAGGQQLLVDVFRGINDTVAALLPGIRDLGMAILSVIGMLAQSGVFTGFATALSSIMTAAAPLLTVLGALASTVLPPLLSAVSALAPVLVPLAAGLLAIRAASAGLDRLRTFGTNMGAARANVVEAISPMRQLSGEMRVQSALARQAGVSHAGLRGAVAAMANSQSAAASAVGKTAQAMAADYRRTATAVQGFADRAGASAQRAGDALGARLAAQVSRGVEAVIRVPGAVADAARRTATAARNMGRSLSTGLQTGVIYARETLRQLPQMADRAMERLRTSLYAGAVNASDAFRTAAFDIRRGVAIAADAATDLGRRVRDGAVTAANALRQLPARAAEAGRALGTGLREGARTAVTALRDASTRAVEAGRSLGTGLRNGVTTAVTALRELPAQAANAGRSLRTGLETGVIYARESLRQLPADAANAGRALATGLRTGVSAAGDAMRTFGTTVASGVRTAAEGVATGLRSIPGHVQNAFSSLGSAASTAIGHLGRLSGAAAGAARSIGTGILRAGGSLVGFLGGPWGVALTVAGAALSIFGEKQADAARKAQEHQAALDTLRGTLDSYSGAVTQATVNERASQLQKDGSLAMLDRLKVSTSDYTQATLGNQEALDRVVPKLFELTQAGIANSNAFKGNKDLLDANGISLDTLTRAAMGYGPAQEEVNRKLAAMGSAGPEAKAEMDMLGDALMNAGGDAATLAQKLGLSVAEVKQMQDATRSAATASQDFQNSLRGLTPAMAGIKDGVAPTAALANGLRDLAGSAGTAAQQAGEAAAKLGGVDAGAKAARDSMQGSRDAFVAAAQSAGMTADQANALSNQIGLIPAAAETNFRINATGVAAEMNTLKAQIAAVPAGKEVRVQALTDEARVRLESLGFQVEQMKDGTFVIRGNTDDARAKLQDLDTAAKAPATKPLLGDPSDVLSKDAAARGAIQTPATKPMLADPSDVRGKDAEARGLIQQPATKPLEGNPAGVLGVNGTATSAIQQPATKPLLGNPADALGKNQGVVSAVQAPATKPINATDGGARGVVNSFVGWVSTLSVAIRVVANKIGFADGGIMPMEHGGIMPMEHGGVIPMAGGGGNGIPREWNGHRLTPMNTTARIVGPRTYRVVGDRAQGDEAYIPLVPSSGWSQTLLAISAQRMGKEIVPAGTVARMNNVAERYRIVRAAAVEPMASGGMVAAAQAILGRMRAGGQMSEDWTWKGAPSVVGQYNDALFDAMKRAGYRYADGRRFLEDYVRRASASAAVTRPVASAVARPSTMTTTAMRAQVQTVQAAQNAQASAVAGGLAELRALLVETRAQTAEARLHSGLLRGLRGDVTMGGGSSDIVSVLNRLRDDLTRLPRMDASERAMRARERGALGLFHGGSMR